MNLRNKDFYTKTIIMYSLILILNILALVMPNNFYNHFISHTRIFDLLSISLVTAGILGTIVTKIDNK
jgi:ABC-type uncharacterized transport system permease subunit